MSGMFSIHTPSLAGDRGRDTRDGLPCTAQLAIFWAPFFFRRFFSLFLSTRTVRSFFASLISHRSSRARAVSRAATLLSCLFLFLSPVRAQVLPVGDALEDYGRILQLTGRAPSASFAVRPISMPFLLGEAVVRSDHPWARRLQSYDRGIQERTFKAGLLTSESEGYWNSARANGSNNGALWQGRGATSAAATGLFAKAGPLSVSLRPRFVYAQNRAFELSPLPTHRIFSEFAYPTLATQSSQFPVLKSTIDWPQRFGPEAFTQIDPGQSYVRVGFRGLGIGASSENLWWGPGIQNAIMLSNNAPGIRHAFLGTSYPLDLWVGRLEGRWLWGKLYESEYYDSNAANDERFFTAIVLSFSPRLLPGFSFGAMRAYNKDLEDSKIHRGDYFKVLDNIFKRTLSTPDNPSGLDRIDQMITVFGRWAAPENGFEVYGEWAKGDHSWDFRDAIVQLQHASGYTVGLQKVIEASSRRWWRVNAEVTKLEAPKSDVVRGIGGYFYEHVFVRQGFTNEGQILGASIGPGSNSQYVGGDLLAPWGRAGLYLRRVALNNDRYYRAGAKGEGQHEVEITGGLRGLLFFKRFELEGTFALEHLLNKHYEDGNDELNVHLGLSVRKLIMGFR